MNNYSVGTTTPPLKIRQASEHPGSGHYCLSFGEGIGSVNTYDRVPNFDDTSRYFVNREVLVLLEQVLGRSVTPEEVRRRTRVLKNGSFVDETFFAGTLSCSSAIASALSSLVSSGSVVLDTSSRYVYYRKS